MKQGGVTNMEIEWFLFFVQKHGKQAESETTFQDKKTGQTRGLTINNIGS